MHSPIDMDTWKVAKIVVIGPGIVGMPMAAMLAHAKIRIGSDEPAKVVVIQRNSATSGWKVDAINAGKSVIGGIEPELDSILADAVSGGLLRASHHYEDAKDADVILFCVQTDKKGFGPDYGPMFEALTGVAEALRDKLKDKVPLIVFESTLAPSSMATIIKDHFARYRLVEGRDILLGNSPNRVMPGRLVERVAESDKLIGGLSPITPQLIKRLYSEIVTQGNLYCTNSLTAEIVKTLENAYRDMRIAYAAEIVRYCDENDIDFYQVRELVNKRLAQEDAASANPNAVPSGGLLVSTVGVGGHCLPKDGILLWWRKIASGDDTSKSLILEARAINDRSPQHTIQLAQNAFGDISGKSVAVLGAAYRFNSEDSRNSASLQLAIQLMRKGCAVRIHDPYVKPTDQNILRFELQSHFTRDIDEAVTDAEYLFFCTAHKDYAEGVESIVGKSNGLRGIMDACNLFRSSQFKDRNFIYTGIGKGHRSPPGEFVDFVFDGFRLMECGTANELSRLIHFLNDQYAKDEFNRAKFEEVQHLAGSCVTGCCIVEPAAVDHLPEYQGFTSRLVRCAYEAEAAKQSDH